MPTLAPEGSTCVSDTSEVEFPPILARLAHALAHDAQAPLRMLGPVLTSLESAGEPKRQQRLAIASQSVGDLDRLISQLVEGLRAPIGLDGTTSGDELTTIVQRLWDGLASSGDHLDLALTSLPLPGVTCETVMTDLLVHALADRGADSRQVAVAATADGNVHSLSVTDDGRAPGASPAGPVRPVGGSTARALLAAQRVAEALQGRLKVAPHEGAVRVTLYWRDARGERP